MFVLTMFAIYTGTRLLKIKGIFGWCYIYLVHVMIILGLMRILIWPEAKPILSPSGSSMDLRLSKNQDRFCLKRSIL